MAEAEAATTPRRSKLPNPALPAIDDSCINNNISKVHSAAEFSICGTKREGIFLEILMILSNFKDLKKL